MFTILFFNNGQKPKVKKVLIKSFCEAIKKVVIMLLRGNYFDDLRIAID